MLQECSKGHSRLPQKNEGKKEPGTSKTALFHFEKQAYFNVKLEVLIAGGEETCDLLKMRDATPSGPKNIFAKEMESWERAWVANITLRDRFAHPCTKGQPPRSNLD